LHILFQRLLFNSSNKFHVRLFSRESFPRYRTARLRPFPLVCNILCNSVATRAIRLVCLLGFLGAPIPGNAQAVAADDTCTKVRQVFVGLNDIAKKGNTKIVPFSREYEYALSAYFERGCPQSERFPLPRPGTDMLLANTASGAIVGGGIKFHLGDPLLRR
jgi:hypothetical protein